MVEDGPGEGCDGLELWEWDTDRFGEVDGVGDDVVSSTASVVSSTTSNA